jgi:predicted AlkP superfamily phosphohydrolase/phosphomutase
MTTHWKCLAYCAAGALLLPSAAFGYIGPGAGFAFLSSFIFILGGILLAIVVLLTFPLRLCVRRLRSRKARPTARVGRLIVVGLDGLDPELALAYMNDGKLPNLSALSREGCFSPLRTTNPPISPVAWSSFMTGVNPGKHNIFDFLSRNAKTYMPSLSSAEIVETSRSVSLKGWHLPRGKPRVKMLRKSVPFWKILGEHGVPSIILKVPITFPPEKFNGLLLSGLCTPDLKGSQGTFTFYTDRVLREAAYTGGSLARLEGRGPVFDAFISGPKDPFRADRELQLPLRIVVDRKGKSATLTIGRVKLRLHEGELTDWIRLKFKAGFATTITGIAHFFLKRTAPFLELYLSPVHIDPERPALPISHPLIYSVYLSKITGPYATLGLPQDTWALNEKVFTDDAFLRQTYRMHTELEEIFFNSMAQLNRGVLCCVFDTTDAVQHEFWRYLDKDHPALPEGQVARPSIIADLYARMDELVGRIRKRLLPGDVLIVLSDHGFKTFRRGVNLNTWLYKNGYLCLRDDAKTCGEWFKGVDWRRTKAYALGLAGVYLNLKGREAEGSVEACDTEALKKELAGKISGLKDEQSGSAPIAAVYDTKETYLGPYVENAPDLIVGYRPGYRASWESVTGQVGAEVIEDNERAWSADHCIDHRFVPGVFFCNRKIGLEKPHIRDVAPTVLDLFGIAPPAYMDGKVMGIEE